MKKIFIAIIMVLPMTMGCSHSPIPNSKTYWKNEQQLMQAAHHWKLYAALEADKISASIPAREILFIDTDDKASPFEQALNSLLVSQLLARNAMVVIDPELSSTTITYHAQIISHNKQGIATTSLTDIGDTFLGREGTEEKVEVLITTQAIKNRQIIVSDSQIYYFYPENIHNYREPKVLATFNVTDIR